MILAGGSGVRLGGADKASLEVGGVTLLETALEATTSADEVVVVGNEVQTSRAVTWTREHPVGGGPAAGLLAGLDAFLTVPDLVCVLAVDMPKVTSVTVTRLVRAVTASADVDAAVIVDAAGRRQTLAGVYRHGRLASARPPDRTQEHGLPIRALVAPLRIVEVAAVGQEAHDVDTWEDLRQLGE